MKSLNIYIEGLLNKSNKSSVLNVGEEIATIIREKAIKTNTRGSVDWDPAKKVLRLKGDYSDLLDCEIINLLNTIPGVTLDTDFFHQYIDRKKFPEGCTIDFNITSKRGCKFDISDGGNLSIENCMLKTSLNWAHRFNVYGGNLSFINVKFIGNKRYTFGAGLNITMHDPKEVPTFKNVELQDIPLEIKCPAWRKYSDKVKECIENDTNPGDVIKMFGLDGITKENLRDLKKPYIKIKCPFRISDATYNTMKISRVKPEDKKYIEQNGWFIYFS